MVNGANGTIKALLYKPNENLPFEILIYFDDYIGPKFFLPRMTLSVIGSRLIP